MKPTETEIEELKKNHGAEYLRRMDVILSPAEENSEGKETKPAETTTYILKVPSRTVLDVVSQHGVNKDVAKSNAALIKNCVLWGDKELMDKDGTIYAAVIAELRELTEIKKSVVTKL